MQSTLDLTSLAPAEPVALLAPRTLAGRAALVVAASALVAAAAHISIPLYFTPVPLTLQTLAVLLVGLALGPVASFSAMVLYLVEGSAGLPVFSPHGLGLFGPTGGYLLSYPLLAVIAGWSVRVLARTMPRFPAAFVAGALASTVTLVLGPVWMAHQLHLSLAAAVHMGVTPFLPGDLIKVTAAATAYSALRSAHRI
jgi:biotin transport system substrate-specific component